MAATSFFGGEFFGGEFFNVVSAGVPLGGKGDNERLRARGIPVKPTGLLHRPVPQGRKEVEDRAADTAQIAAEVSAKVAREFGEEVEIERIQALAIEEMSQEQIATEIRERLLKKLQDEEDMMLMIAMIAAAS